MKIKGRPLLGLIEDRRMLKGDTHQDRIEKYRDSLAKTRSKRKKTFRDFKFPD